MTQTDVRPSAAPTTTETDELDQPIKVTRRKIDNLLIGVGITLTVLLAAAGGLLLWGSTFAQDYVSDELAAQNIAFPPEERLVEEGRDDLVQYAGQPVDTGEEAEAYASFIAGHVANVADGATYADLGSVERAAATAVDDAIAAGAPADEVAALQAEADEVAEQRETIFRGEMLRGTLLNTYAWSTIGVIAGIAAIVALAGALVMLILVIAGELHLRRQKHH